MTSLKWKIAKYLLFFGACLVGLNALFQIVLLEPMYENSKINTVKKASNDIVGSIEEDNLTDMMYRVSAENDLCIRIYSENSSIYAGNMGCVLYRMSDVELVKEISKARQNNNTYLSTKAESFDGSKDSIIKDITYTRIVEDNDSTYIVMVNTSITPVDATVSTLTNQLWIISVFVLIVVAILVLVMNRNIAAPLTTLNNSAKLLSKGTYTYDDKVNAYQEVYELNETLKKAAVDIQKADQAKRDLIANVSHDLRTPLTSISGNASTLLYLEQKIDDETRKQIYTDIYDDAEWLTNVVENLLSVTRLNDGKLQINLSLQVVEDVIDEALKHVNRKISEHHLVKDYSETILLANMDARLIIQVIINLVDNAIKYTPAGSTITVRARKADNKVKISVIDDGPGIKDEQKPHIFEMFFTGQNKVIDSQRSLGLGLALCKSIINTHGGELTLTDAVPHGCNFTFTLESKEVNINEQ